MAYRELNGMQIIETRSMCDNVEDWSGCRSPSRARRRYQIGHPQRMIIRQVPKKTAVVDKINGKIYIHPETAKELYRRIDELNLQRPNDGRAAFY